MTIVVLQRGWVAVGVCELTQPSGICRLSHAAIIRRWGTDKGLPQLAAEGPKTETILDPAPHGIHYHYLSEVLTLPCNPEAWKEYANGRDQ